MAQNLSSSLLVDVSPRLCLNDSASPNLSCLFFLASVEAHMHKDLTLSVCLREGNPGEFQMKGFTILGLLGFACFPLN